MPRSKRKGTPGKAVVHYGSDDERAYKGEATPDPEADDFFHDEVDQFHAQQEKLLLDQGASLEPAGSDSEKEEILGVGGSLDDSDGDDIAEYEKRLRRFRSQGFKDDMASDLEDEGEDADEKGLPDNQAWGKSASKFYGADVSDDDYDVEDHSGSEPDTAILEEQEALAIQKKMAAQLDDADIGLHMFKPSAKKLVEAKEEELIKKDLSKLSKKEKLKLLKKESPELLELMQDFKAKMNELEEHLLPIYNLIRDKKLPPSKGASYVTTKTQLYLNYCVNLSFYLMLKAKHTPVQNHPVIGRLVQYRNLIQQLDTVEGKVRTEMDYILERVSRGEDVPVVQAGDSARLDTAAFVQRKKASAGGAKSAKKARLSELVSGSESEDEEEEATAMSGKELLAKGGKTWGRKRSQAPKAGGESQYETRDEQQALEYYRMLKAGRGLASAAGETEAASEGPMLGQDMPGVGGEEGPEGEAEAQWEGEEEGDGRRAIDYTIAKNKGLTRKRKKEYRNPRVRNRLRHKEALKRRKGQVRVARKEIAPYAGELSGIRAGVKKSIKFKS